MTWGEFKKQVEAAGTEDDAEISSIDVSGWCDNVDIDIEDGVVSIY